jgi:guanosine-3',5'-bis(diphosphate) 3'-pyrophosphohydrolase
VEVEHLKGSTPFIDKAVAFQAARRSGLNLEPTMGMGCFLDPLDVLRVLLDAGENDPFLLVAAVLHDLLERTDLTESDIAGQFGSEVAFITAEVADHPKLSLASRKAQLQRAIPQMSRKARLLRQAQLVASVRNLGGNFVPATWSARQRKEYLDWADKTFAALGVLNSTLQAMLMAELEQARLASTR